ncbi:MAG TPA: DUF5317 family protein [Frankiaceae bacterium]|jgi:hypothetical protein|nr:DUF5317 family protein [Frankiaceae bacterium]
MFVAFIAVVLLLTVPLAGGKLSALARIRLRGKWLVMAALGVQILITGALQSWPHGVLVALHLASYGLIGIAIWWNRRLPGLLIIGLGGLMNGVVIALNDGTLPASARALAAAGTDLQKDFNNSAVLAHPVLAPLGDVVATPAWLPFRNVISIGDVIALVGVAVLVHTVCESKLTAPLRRRFSGRAQPPAESAAAATL